MHCVRLGSSFSVVFLCVPLSSDVYQIKELTSETQIKLLDRISVLIDGEYKEELNDGAFLRGSSNQIIHILNDQYRDKYEKYIRGNHNEIQNFMINNEVISVGIHNKEFRF